MCWRGSQAWPERVGGGVHEGGLGDTGWGVGKRVGRQDRLKSDRPSVAPSGARPEGRPRVAAQHVALPVSVPARRLPGARPGVAGSGRVAGHPCRC